MAKISRDTPLPELTLRKYEKPQNMSRRELVRKFCLSLGLLQPGDSRDVVVDVLHVLLENTKLSSKDVEHDFVLKDKILWIDGMKMAIRGLETKKSSGKGTYHILTNDIFGKLDDVFEECKGRWNIETHNKFEKHVLGMNSIKSKSKDGVKVS